MVWKGRRDLRRLQSEDQLLDDRLKRLMRTNFQLRAEKDVILRPVCFALTRADIEENMSHLRGLTFRQPVRYRRMRRGELREYILAKLGSQYTPEEFQDYAKALKRIGLLPRETDLMKAVTDLFSEQVAAFYDPDTHELFTFEDLSLQNNFERMILAHELVHALQDQNFDFKALALRSKNNDDAALAAQALVEGDACYEMGVYLRRNYKASQILSDLGLLFSQSTEKLFSAPVWLRDSLTFPYQEGQIFAAILHAEGGNPALDRAFKNPPLSTEQVLHPEKYLSATPDVPRPVSIAIEAKPVWRKSHENVVGELGIRSLFSQTLGLARAEQAAAGWGGDRYLVYETGHDQWVVVWKSAWDSPSDAREFFDALEDHYHARYETRTEEAFSRKRSKAERKPPVADSVFFSIANQKQNLIIDRDTVLYLDVPDAATMQFLLSKLHRIN